MAPTIPVLRQDGTTQQMSAAEMHALEHETEVVPRGDGWVARCRCGWLTFQIDAEEDARAVADDHAADA